MDECNSASEICKSFDVLQAIRRAAIAWNDISKTAIVKCFAKVEVFRRRKTNAVTSKKSDVDSFADLGNEFAFVQDLNETNSDEIVSLRQVVLYMAILTHQFVKNLQTTGKTCFSSKCNVIRKRRI